MARKYASTRQSLEWRSTSPHPMLRRVFLDAERYALAVHKWTFRVTSIYRTPKEDAALRGTGVHCAWRALDVGAADVHPDIVKDVCAFVNSRYLYDHSRPSMVCAYAAPHGTGPHVHFQVHPATREYEGPLYEHGVRALVRAGALARVPDADAPAPHGGATSD